MKTAMDVLPDESREHLKPLAIAILSVWFLIALTCSMLGAFDSGHRPPIALGAAAALPVIVFVVFYFQWPAFHEWVQAANLRVLTLAQTWRVAAVTFLILSQQGVLPRAFALPAGWGDIAIGATAPLIALAISSSKVFPRRIFVVWNVLGLLDLAAAVTLGILASAGPAGILAGDITTEAMGRFPLSLIPTFFVPVLAVFHLISLVRVSSQTLE